jgi:hypothetical protein
MNIINQWFKVIDKYDDIKFPGNFDFNFFLKGIELLLNHDHSVTTSKCLWLLYNTLHIFPLHRQQKLIERIIKDRFESLFFHWSWNIRTTYHKLYLYQIYRRFIETIIEGDQKGESFQYKRKLSKNLHMLEADTKFGVGMSVSGNTFQYTQSKMIKDIKNIVRMIQKKIDSLVEQFDENKEYPVEYTAS